MSCKNVKCGTWSFHKFEAKGSKEKKANESNQTEAQKLHKQKKSEPVLIVDNPCKEHHGGGDQAEDGANNADKAGTNDISSFSTMKQNFYYASKILTLQKKIADQVKKFSYPLIISQLFNLGLDQNQSFRFGPK